MASVKKGANRQDIHKIIRDLSLKASQELKEGQDNKLIDYLAENTQIPLNKDEILKLLNPEMFIGRAKEQVEEFINSEIKPFLEKHCDLSEKEQQLNV